MCITARHGWKQWVLWPVTGQQLLISVVSTFFTQESKRSVEDLCGRTDGNMKVIFPKEDVAVQPAASNAASVHAGDYVLVKVGLASALFQKEPG